MLTKEADDEKFPAWRAVSSCDSYRQHQNGGRILRTKVLLDLPTEKGLGALVQIQSDTGVAPVQTAFMDRGSRNLFEGN